MFENIHLQFKKIYPPVTPDNPATLAQYSHFLQEEPSEEVEEMKRHGDFCLDGEIHISPILPVSEFARRKLYYIKAFVVMKSGTLYRTRRKDENSCLLLYTYDGNGCLEYNGQRHLLSKGDGFLIDCRQPHYYYTCGDNWSHIDFHFLGAETELYAQYLMESQQGIFFQPLNGLFERQLEELMELYENVTPYRELLISAKINSLLSLLLTSSREYQHLLERRPESLCNLIKYINNFYYKNLSLDFMSSYSGISKPHLIRLFRKYLDCTPREYVISQQIENAKNLLETTTFPINKVGATVGIENSSYFSSLFKARTGMSPGEYRSQNSLLK